MRLSDDRYENDRRKYLLALSMIEHGARIGTVMQWTGLSKYRVQTLSHSYASATRIHRNRGESPSQPSYFSKSLELARESMALAYIAVQMRVIPEAIVPDARRSLPGLACGERLMGAFEVYRALLPGALISLEYAILLITELAERRTLTLANCRNCHDVMVVDRFGTRHDLCPFCRQPKRRARGGSRHLLRQQQFHQGVEEHNEDRTHHRHDQNEPGRKMGFMHEGCEE
jgi:Zn-finger nucleic acid-binding protein